MKRKHTKSFLLVSVATTLAGCGGSTDDNADRGSDREAASEGPNETDQSDTPVAAPVGSMPTPFYNGGDTTSPAQPQPQVVDPPPGMGAEPATELPFPGNQVDPDYEGPIVGTPAQPAYGGSGGQFVGAGAGPVYIGEPEFIPPGIGGAVTYIDDPVEPEYGGAGGSLPFPGEPVEPEYGGEGGTAGSDEVMGGAGGAEPYEGGAGGMETGGGATNGGDTSDPEDGIGGASN